MESAFEVLLLHPAQSSAPDAVSLLGTLYWRLDADRAIDAVWDAGSAKLEAGGYRLERFLEGDGASFGRNGLGPYDAEQALADMQEAFPQFSFTVARSGEANRLLAKLNEGTKVRCIALVPVEHLRMAQVLRFGAFTLYPAVDGDMMTIEDHPWGTELSDVDPDDLDPHWYPEPPTEFNEPSDLLARPLIEIGIDVPVSLLYLARGLTPDRTPLVNYVLELADSCLDIVRVRFCNHRRLELTPGRAGRLLDGVSAFYLMPEHDAFRPQLHLHIPDAFSVSNNWLGLEIDEFEPDSLDDMASKILMHRDERENQGVIRHAIRTIGTSFYLIVPEASFLQLIYALDAVSAVDKSGAKHRLHIAALTCGWDEHDLAGSLERFQKQHQRFCDLYATRNEIVHNGGTFATLGRDGSKDTDSMTGFVWLCCETLLSRGLKTDEDVRAHVQEVLKLAAPSGTPKAA